MTATVSRDHLVRTARRLALFTVGWNVLEGFVAVTAALIASSQALLGFGLDSAVESISGAVLLWRLGVERRDPERADEVEQRALKLIAVSFFVLAAFVAFESIRSLIGGDQPETSTTGIVLTALSLIVMPVLARRKRAVGEAMGSRAVIADSQETVACVYLSLVVLAGLIANAAFGWWWADAVAALGVVVFLVLEGREALEADHVDACC